jgi:thiamine-monophosphate kinase
VEGDHFRLDWSSPEQVGSKLVESNVSDIICKGGKPSFAFLSICLRKDCTVELMDAFYQGLYAAADRHGLMLVGGDTTHGPNLVLNLTVIGEAGDRVPLRSGAQPGDLLCVTGNVGGSTAGLKLLLRARDWEPGLLRRHLEPRSRLVAEGRAISRYATSTIDVSDGLASETAHVCGRSGVGARIDLGSVPLSSETRRAGELLGLDPLDFALYGGEDYEICFTIRPEDEKALRREFNDFTVVGEMLGKDAGFYLIRDGKAEEPKRGYDHFA